MTETIPVAVPRKGRPLETVLDGLARRLGIESVADEISSTLRHEKAVTKDQVEPGEADVYRRLADYSDADDPTAPEYTLLRDDRAGYPRRIVFDSLRISLDDVDDAPEDTEIQLVAREEPFRALRTHSFALGYDSADLVLEEVVELRPDPIGSIADVNERIDPAESDVRVVTGLGDTVYHTLLATPDASPSGDPLDRSFLDRYEGPICIEPRYERLVRAVLGNDTLEGIEFLYPDAGRSEEAAIADTGVGVYLTVTGSTAREHGLLLGEQLFPSETVLMANETEIDGTIAAIRSLLADAATETELSIP